MAKRAGKSGNGLPADWPFGLRLHKLCERLNIDLASPLFWQELALALLPGQQEFHRPRGRPKAQRRSDTDEMAVMLIDAIVRQKGTKPSVAIREIVGHMEQRDLLTKGATEAHVKRIKRLYTERKPQFAAQRQARMAALLMAPAGH